MYEICVFLYVLRVALLHTSHDCIHNDPRNFHQGLPAGDTEASQEELCADNEDSVLLLADCSVCEHAPRGAEVAHAGVQLRELLLEHFLIQCIELSDNT